MSEPGAVSERAAEIERRRAITFLAGQGPASRAFYALARTLVAGFTRLWTRLGIEGRHHVPKRGAFVLAPVHRSIIDTPISSCLTRRRLRFMGKDTLWRKPAPAWLLSALGGFPVVRGTADREALTRCIAVLEAGEPLVLFPEGERKSGSTVQPLFDGAAYVALRTGVPIVPVGIGGSERVMPKGSRFIYPRKVNVVVGEPITRPLAAGRRIPRSLIREVSDELHQTLQRLFDEARQRAGA
jgi:1-acyl-sn-glycerol-3-phosphate acyltransferase